MRPNALALVLTLCISGCGRPDAAGTPAPATAVASSAAPTTLRFIAGVNLDVRDVPLLMAFDELASRGYLVEKNYLASNTMLADALVRGDADVAVLNHQTAWSAIGKGADIRTVSEFTVYTGLFIARDDIRSCHDLDGHRVGIPSTVGFAPLMFFLYLSQECPEVKPQVLTFAEASARAAALLAGRIDASMIPGEELLKLQRQSPTIHVIGSPSSLFPGVRVDGLQVRGQWADAHPEAVKALVSAQIRAHRLVRSSPQVLYDEAVRHLSLDAATARAISDSHLERDIWDANGGLTLDNIRSTIDFLMKADALPTRVTPEQVSDLSYLNAVLAEVGRIEPPLKGTGQPVQGTGQRSQ
jgi:NitT/TauT family transport system substrate-binding protein